VGGRLGKLLVLVSLITRVCSCELVHAHPHCSLLERHLILNWRVVDCSAARVDGEVQACECFLQDGGNASCFSYRE
jgi:hypothetical protein